MIKTQQLLVISDTHGTTTPIDNILTQHPAITNIFHCGDSELNHNDPLLKNIHMVRGNCDYDHSFPNELVMPIDGYVIYITHGHLYGVKSSRHQLAKRAQTLGATIALYGHTHVAKIERIDNIHCINPGSIAYPRGNIWASYCIISLSNSENRVDFYDLAHVKI